MTVLATGGALLFSKADQAERIAADARTLGELQAASAETATFRAALVIAFASTGDVVPAVALEAVDEAVDAARRAEGPTRCVSSAQVECIAPRRHDRRGKKGL